MLGAGASAAERIGDDMDTFVMVFELVAGIALAALFGLMYWDDVTRQR